MSTPVVPEALSNPSPLNDPTLPPYWKGLGYREVAPHVFRHGVGERSLSAERLHSTLQHNLRVLGVTPTTLAMDYAVGRE